MAHLCIVSDMHIWGKDDPLYRSLLQMLKLKGAPGNVIVLAGDIFDVFVGHKHVYLDRYREFFDAARESCSRGARIHYIEGNHDFLMAKALRSIPGMQVHTREVSVEIENKRFYIAHGDLVDPHDISYRLLRAVFRSPINRGLVRVLPGTWVDWIGNQSSKYSRGAKPLLPKDLPLDRLDRLRKLYRNFAVERLGKGFDFVIMGHCHDLDQMSFTLGDRTCQYANVGFPRVHGTYLSWTSGETQIYREPLPMWSPSLGSE